MKETIRRWRLRAARRLANVDYATVLTWDHPVSVDRDADAIYVRLGPLDAEAAYTDQRSPNLLVDYAANGSIVGVELLGIMGGSMDTNILDCPLCGIRGRALHRCVDGSLRDIVAMNGGPRTPSRNPHNE